MNKSRYLTTYLALAALLLTAALAACNSPMQTAGDLSVAGTLTAVPPAATTPPTAEPTTTPEPSATPPPTPLPTREAPTPTPTATPRPATLAAPQEWADLISAALSEEASTDWAWSVLAVEDPQAALDDGRAEAAIVSGSDGTVVRQEPLAFSVPFTTNWERLGAADADAIVVEGHSLIQMIPWSAMTPDNKALRVDGLHPTDPDYPYHLSWSLVAVSEVESAITELAPTLTEALTPLPSIRLAAVGDINMDRAPAYILTELGDLPYPFALVKPVFDAADYTIGNLETALGDVGEPAAKRYPFRSPPVAAEALAVGGVDLVSLANNHAQDYGPEALLQGIDLLHAAGVATVGGGANDEAAHAPHVADIGGLRVAFLGYVHVPIEAVTNFDTQTWAATADAPGLAWGDPARIRADVAAARPEADLVVVILHSGYEYIEEPSEEQVAAARAAVDAGADLVVGHHAHILQGIHRYTDGVIAYGLGNFVFDIDGPPETTILNVWLDRDGVRQLELIPAIILEHGRPRLAEPSEAGPILSRVYYLTTILNAGN